MPAGYIIYVPDVSRLSLGMTKQENTVFCISAKEEFNPINKSEEVLARYQFSTFLCGVFHCPKERVHESHVHFANGGRSP